MSESVEEEVVEPQPQPSETLNPFQQLGLQLKGAREARQMSLQHVSEVTRINTSSLQSIEDGTWDHHPGDVFMRGFVRTYAKLLGIEDQALQQQFPVIFASHPSESMTPTVPEDDSHVAFRVSTLGLFALCIVGVIALVIFLQQGDAPEESTTTAETEELSVSEEPVEGVAGVAPGSLEEGALEGAVTPEPTPPPPPGLSLSVQAFDPTWVHVSIDDGAPFESLVQPGDQVEWQANERYQVTIGNTKGIQMSLNGKLLTIDQEKDLLINWVIDRGALVEQSL